MNPKATSIFTPSHEHELLRAMVRRFAQNDLAPGAHARDEKEFFDLSLFRKLGPLGLLGLCAEVKYGGAAMDAVAAVIANEEIAAVDPGFGLAYLAHAMLCVNNIAQNADEEQKKRYLPKLCSGEWVGAMAMSEPSVGTDVLGMSTTAAKSSAGYLVNGRKMWITNGAQDDQKTPADVLFLYAKTDGDKGARVSSFIVERGQPGYLVGQKLTGKLGMRASITAELVLENCALRQDQLVGNEGDSMIHMMRNLEIERLTLAAMSLGIARRSLDIMNRYARERTAFGHTLSHFGQVQQHIADGYAKFKACRALVYQTAFSLDLKSAGNRMDSDAAKLMAGRAAKEIADSAIQVLGGYGYMSEYVVERLWRDAKLLEIGGGTNEAHQKNITADLGKYPHMIYAN
jgi:isovaleryl-CoA dehydrogenase